MLGHGTRARPAAEKRSRTGETLHGIFLVMGRPSLHETAHGKNIMNRTNFTLLTCLAASVHFISTTALQAENLQGWFHWRGPYQDGTTRETQLPEDVDAADPLWQVPLSGMSTPTIHNGRLFIMGYEGAGPNLQELIACYDAETGEKQWEHRFNDFLSDIIYERYSTSSPTIDPETGNVYMQGSQGIVAGFSPEGEMLWKHSMMELYGRMTFPNGRTASFVVDKDVAITHHITANWGANGPARDRFYAFDTHTGELVWYSTPGGQPKDSSFSPPVLSWYNGQRVFYCGTGDGAVVCANARSGEPIWRVKISQGGVNSGVLIHNEDKIIAIHGRENLDNSEIGRMVAIRIPETVPEAPPGEAHVFDMKELELWRNPLSAFTSSPILVGDTVYQVAETGDLCAVDAGSGEIRWKQKLGIEQRNASLLFADGKLYIPMLEDPDAKVDAGTTGTKGAFYIIQPEEDGCTILDKETLDGRCFGSPTIYNGKIYVQTTQNLYCFGKEGNSAGLPEARDPVQWPEPSQAAQLQVIPSEVLLAPGEKISFRVRTLDANGFVVRELEDPAAVEWASYIPPTAKVRVRMNAEFNDKGELVANDEVLPSAGAYEASWNGLKGYIRGRVLPSHGYEEDFERFELKETHSTENVAFAYPPLPWIGARFKFEIRDRDNNNVLTKTIDNKLFQRAYVFLGHPEMKDYTIEADVLTDGNRRKMSEVGLICNRYFIVLKGNYQQLEVNSNLERVRQSVSFRILPNVWYRLKARVETGEDGSGVVRAKAWKKGDPEPENWTIEVPHKTAHANGSPGLFGFAPQEMRVHIDNIKVLKN